jgi:hypothetical protein
MLLCLWLFASGCLILRFLSGQDNKEDCAEATVPELQALLPACDQGPYISSLFSIESILPLRIVSEFLLATYLQRCKHFEIGGDKKGKGTSLFWSDGIHVALLSSCLPEVTINNVFLLFPYRESERHLLEFLMFCNCINCSVWSFPYIVCWVMFHARSSELKWKNTVSHFCLMLCPWSKKLKSVRFKANLLEPCHLVCSGLKLQGKLVRKFHTLLFRRIFFLYCIFFSFFRSSMINLAITKVEHCCIRQMRFLVIVFGGHDNTAFEALGARWPTLLNPADSTCPCRSRQTRLHRAGPDFICCRARRLREGGLRAEKRCAHPLGSALLHSPTRLASLCSSLFSLLSSASALTSHSEILFLRFREHFLIKISEICCKK